VHEALRRDREALLLGPVGDALQDAGPQPDEVGLAGLQPALEPVGQQRQALGPTSPTTSAWGK
jgi:hypothetical protein